MDPNWLVGFLEGEGCFYVSVTKSKSCATGHQVRLEFILTQDSRDIGLLSSLSFSFVRMKTIIKT